MKLMLIRNDGDGFVRPAEVRDGMTVEQLFRDQFGDANPNSYTIRVNREAVSATQILSDGDRVSFTPTKIAGA
jgi:sulfur carrier protein ThiS